MKRRRTAAHLQETAPSKTAVNTNAPVENQAVAASQQVAQIARQFDREDVGGMPVAGAGFSRLQSTLGNQAMMRLLKLNTSNTHAQRKPAQPQNFVELMEENEDESGNTGFAPDWQDQWGSPDEDKSEGVESEEQDALADEALMSENPAEFDPDANTPSEYEDNETMTSRDPALQNENDPADLKDDQTPDEPIMSQENEGDEAKADTSTVAGGQEPISTPGPATSTQTTTATTAKGTAKTATTAGGKTAVQPQNGTVPENTPAGDPVVENVPAPVAGGSDLVTKELAEHDRWGKYGAPGSDARQDWVINNVVGGFGEGVAGGAVMGVGVHALGKGVEWAIKKGAVKKMGTAVATQAFKHMPVPAVGAVVGGLLSGYNLVTRDWSGNWDNISKGFSFEGKTTYENIANLLQGISDIVDILSQVLNVVAGVAGAIAVGSWLLTFATAGALTPVAAAATSFAAAISIITGVMDIINGFVIQPAITAFRAMDAMDMDADPVAMEKAAKDIRGAAAGPGAALGAYAATPAIEGGGKLKDKFKAKEPTANTPPAVGTASQTPHVTVQATEKSAHLVQSAEPSAPTQTQGPQPVASTTHPEPSAGTTQSGEPSAAQTTTQSTPEPVAQTPVQVETPAPKPQPEPVQPTQHTEPTPAVTEPVAQTQQAEPSTKADDAAMKPDEVPPVSREEAIARQQDAQKKRDELQKQIDAHDKDMSDAAGEMQKTVARQKELDVHINKHREDAKTAGKLKDQKSREASAADQKRLRAEQALQRAQAQNNPEAVAAAQQEIAAQQTAADNARAEYREAAMQETVARDTAAAMENQRTEMGTDMGWDNIKYDMAKEEKLKLLEQQALLDADIQTTQKTLDALNKQPDTPAPPAPLSRAEEAARLEAQHKELIENNQKLKDEKAKIKKDEKKKNITADEAKQLRDENERKMQENDAALLANQNDQVNHHDPILPTDFDKWAGKQMTDWGKRAETLDSKTPEFAKPPASFNANNLGGTVAGDVFDPMFYAEGNAMIDAAEEAEKKKAALPPAETVNLSPGYQDPPGTPEAVTSLRDQAADLEAQHRQMKAIEGVEATEEAKGEAQKTQAEEAVNQSKAMQDLNRQHGQKTTAGAEANKKQEAEGQKAAGAVEKYEEQGDKFSSFQSVLGTVLGLEHLLDMLPDSVAEYGRSMFGGAHKMHSNLAKMNAGMGEVGATGPQTEQAIDAKGQRFEQTKQENATSQQQIEQNEKGAQMLKAENEQKTAQASENKAEAQATDAEILELKAQKQAQADTMDAQMQQWAVQHQQDREQLVTTTATTAASNGFEVLETSQ